MYSITVKDQLQATQAINWCKKNISKGHWDIHTKWPDIGFVFSFQQQKDASWFTLHWAH